MATITAQELEMKIFTIIAVAGDAKASFYEAFRLVKEGHYEEADAEIQKGSDMLLEAHRVQTDLITNEANGNKAEIGVLMIHAQDHLMNAILVKELLGTMVSMQKEINELKAAK